MTSLPAISIVTPCLNQASYVDQTIESIHGQNYPHLEHVVMDGGSTDGSLEIIKSHEDRLDWVSRPDGGQYQAISEGFARTSGEIMGWLNSDDIYLPGALRAVGEIFRDFPDVEWLTTRFPMAINGDGAPIKMACLPGFSRMQFMRGDHLPAAGWAALGFVQQESTFWRRSLWNKTGARFRGDLRLAADFELWSRFFDHASLHGVDVPLGCFRRHDQQKTSVAFQGYIDEALAVFLEAGGKPPRSTLQSIRLWFLEACGTSVRWRRTARRLGLLPGVNNITYDWARSVWVKEQ